MNDDIIQAANIPPIKSPICYSINQIEVLQQLGNHTFAAQYESDEFMQKIIGLLKRPDSTKINRLPTPWREKYKCLSLDANDFVYMDERLVVPKTLRPIIMRSLHYGHPGRDAMLATISYVWWPRLHREVVTIARECPQCKESGKNIKTILSQKQIGKLPESKECNQEIAIDFAGPFQNAINAKKYHLVSVDHFSGWPEAKFLSKPTTEKVIEFLKNYITRHGIPQTIRTDPATIFRSRRFKEFCQKRLIRHIECPVRDHRANGKIERRNSIRNISDQSQPAIQLSDTDFESGQDSTIMVRERTRGTKLEGVYKKKKGVLLEQSNHTITFSPAGRNQPTIISKRDVAKNTNQPCCSREAAKQLASQNTDTAMARNQPITSEDDSSSEVATRDDLPITINLPETSRPPTPPTEHRRKKKPALQLLKQKVKKTEEGKKMKRAKQNQKPEQITEIGSESEEEMWPQQKAEPKIKEKKNKTMKKKTTEASKTQQP